MKKFWNWIKNSDDTRILRLEGPIDEESFWGDEITPQMFRDELESGEGNGLQCPKADGITVSTQRQIRQTVSVLCWEVQQRLPIISVWSRCV